MKTKDKVFIIICAVILFISINLIFYIQRVHLENTISELNEEADKNLQKILNEIKE